jgi:hypothetical protein
MADARAAASSSDDAAAMVAPLVALWNRAEEMCRLQRWARGLELTERALEQARRTLPPNNLVVAWMIDEVVGQRMMSGQQQAIAESMCATTEREVKIDNNAVVSDPCLKAMSRERLAACCARFGAGTLCTPTPEELAFFSALPHHLLSVPLLERLGEEILLSATADAMHYWPTVGMQELAVLMTGINATLQTALSLDARGELEPWFRKREHVGHLLALVLAGALGDEIPEAERARRTVRISPPETEAKLRRLQARLPNVTELRANKTPRFDPAKVAASNARAAADVARHGLNTCALPACDAKEPHPRFFKCCSRCRSVFYCSQEHQREDWPRHRATDRCTKPAAS